MFGLAAFISPVSVADEAKSDDFDLSPDLNLTCDLYRILLNGSKSAYRELLIAALLRLPVRE